MPPELRLSLDLLRCIMPDDEPWWIIGSTAMYLSDIDIRPRDIDVFAASNVIERARLKLNAPIMPARPGRRFWSSPYFQHTPAGGLEIDFMGDLRVFSGDGWKYLQIKRGMLAYDLPVPSREEQLRILRLFGRPKDLERAALFQA